MKKREGLGWTIQTLPIGDIKEHKTNFPEDCECKIRIDDKTGVIMHDSFDKREKKGL